MNHAIAFIGPSLSADEVKKLGPFELRAPARQGDVFRALVERPAAIALIDGVFEASPSVWHHELLQALASGVAVFAGGSMGALRGAELHRHGVIGVGEIFEAYRDGKLVDDSEVALLHGPEEFQFRPLTLPLVNVRHAASLAIEKKVLSRAEASRLVEVAERIFYQDRTWTTVLEAMHWAPEIRARWTAFAKDGLEDLKASDARAVLEATAKFMRARSALPVGPSPQSSSTRRRRIFEDVSLWGEDKLLGGRVLEALRSHPQASEMKDAGLRRKLISGWARELGVTVQATDLAEAEAAWLASLELEEDEREGFFAANGLDEAQVRELVEELALERKLLDRSVWMISDGPSDDEGLAAEARFSGVWADTVRTLAAPAKSPRSRPKRRR